MDFWLVVIRTWNVSEKFSPQRIGTPQKALSGLMIVMFPSSCPKEICSITVPVNLISNTILFSVSWKYVPYLTRCLMGRSRTRMLNVNSSFKITSNLQSSSSHVKTPIKPCTAVVRPESQPATLSTPKVVKALSLPVATKLAERTSPSQTYLTSKSWWKRNFSCLAMEWTSSVDYSQC